MNSTWPLEWVWLVIALPLFFFGIFQATLTCFAFGIFWIMLKLLGTHVSGCITLFSTSNLITRGRSLWVSYSEGSSAWVIHSFSITSFLIWLNPRWLLFFKKFITFLRISSVFSSTGGRGITQFDLSFRLISITPSLSLHQKITTSFATLSFFARYSNHFSCRDFWYMLWARTFCERLSILSFLPLILRFVYFFLTFLLFIMTCLGNLVLNPQQQISVDCYKLPILTLPASHSWQIGISSALFLFSSWIFVKAG